MGRNIKKGPFADEHLLRRVTARKNAEKKQVIKTRSHRSAIFPSFVGLTIAVYDGRKRVLVYVTEDMIGHELGESVPTRTFRSHKADDKATK